MAFTSQPCRATVTLRNQIAIGTRGANRNPAQVRHHLGQEIYTLVDYRNRYAQYKFDPDLMAAHLSAPFVMAWDDHEVDDDYAGDHDEATDLGRDAPR